MWVRSTGMARTLLAAGSLDAMPNVKVSVVVPVYNPGADIDDCIRTLVHEQSLPTDAYEVIFVDDGSTDETPARLDALAAAHAHVHVEHIPNSGWPGKPRNVGTDMARGEYVYYVDNDDWLAPEALERMYAMAVADEADIVIGKVVSKGKSVPRVLFKKDRHATNVHKAASLMSLLSPHKMFRRSFLDEHGIRFPEGRRRLEDHVFVVHAYLHTDRISVLSSYVCYHWMLRDQNASRDRFEPAGYYDNVREVLDLVERHTEPGPQRNRVLAHWYRGKLMKRVGPVLTRRPPEYQRALHDEVRALALERYGEWIDELLRFNLRVRSWLLRHATFEAVKAFAEYEAAMTVEATVSDVRTEGSTIVVRFDATACGPDGPLAFTQDGQTIRWVAPAEIADILGPAQLDVRGELEESTVELLLEQPDTGVRFLRRASVRVHLEPLDGPDSTITPVVTVEVNVDPAKAAAGAPLPAGGWQVGGNLIVAGFLLPMRVKHPNGRPLQLVVGADGQITSRRPGSSSRQRSAAPPSPWRRAAGLVHRLAAGPSTPDP
jgi:glycosyltransferase involved in cell wall biosynthesis